MNNNNAFPYRAYAMEYGTFLGIAWTAVFFLFIATIRTASDLYAILAFFAFLSLAIIPFLFAWRIKQLQGKGESLGILRGCLFSFNLFMFASLFTGACEYAYFAFFDHGTFVDSFMKIYFNPEIANVYKTAGLNDLYGEAKTGLMQFGNLSPYEKAGSFFTFSFYTSLFFILPVGALASLKSSRKIQA